MIIEILSVIGILFMGYFIGRIIEAVTIGCWCKYQSKVKQREYDFSQFKERAVSCSHT